MKPLLDRQLIRSVCDTAADTYQQAAVAPREIESRLLERLDGLKIEVQKVLNIGAGPAEVSPLLAKRFPGCIQIAVDFSLPMLSAGVGDAAGEHRVCGDAYALPLAEQTFDLVFSNLMLHYCEDLDLVFDQLRRVLKPGGVLLFSYPGPDTLIELRRSWAAVDDQPHVQLFLDMHDIGDALLAAGFADPVLDVEQLMLTYRDVPQLLRELKDLGGSNAAVDRRRGLTGKNRMQAMVDHYQEMHLDDRIPATCEVVYGLAWGPPAGQPRRSGDGQISSFSVEQLRGSRAPRR